MKKLLIIAVLAVAGMAHAGQPDQTLESAGSATGQNIRIASGANASGEYGVVAGSNADAADATTLFAVCEKCDDTTATYVWSITAGGNWTLDASAPLITTASAAAGLNLGVASGADASGEYGVVVGTTAAAAAGLDLFATAVDVDGTPVYSLIVETIAAGGTGARVYNTASASGINLTLASGADGAGEYGVVAGTNAILTVTGQPLFAVAADIDGTPVYTLEVQGIQTTGAGAFVANTSSNAAQNLAIFSGANAAGEYAVEVGSSAAVSDGTQLFAVCSDCDGTEAYVFTVSAAGNVLLDATAPLVTTASAAAGLNLGVASGADALGDYGVTLGTNAAAAALDLVALATDVDGTPVVAASFTSLASSVGGEWHTASSAAGVNFTLASGANASGEYGVVVGTDAAASALVELFGIASDVDGTPIYALSVENIAADGSGASISNTATAAGINLTIASGADAAGEYGVTVGSNAAAADATPLFSVAEDIDGTPTHVFTVDAIGNVGGLLAGRTSVTICGDLDTINNTTLYWGPETTVAASATIGGLQCDTTQAGNATEATVDEKLFNAKAFQVIGMVCHTVDLGTSVIFTLRSAAANLTPSVTCTVADNELDCVADVQTTTAIASGATFALQAFSSSDMGAATVFQCEIDIAY